VANPPTRFEREASQITFSTDGRFLGVVDERGVWLLRMARDDLRKAVCDRVRRELTPDEWRTYAPGATPHAICPDR